MNDRLARIDFDRLARWMDQQGLGEGAIEEAAVLAGGTQNILVRFRRGDREYVLRRPPAHPRAGSNDTMRREMTMLAALADTDVPHPGLLAACAGEDVLGVSFYLMQPIDGFNPTTGLPAPHADDPAMRRRMGLALVEGIAALGAVDYRAVGLQDFGRPEGYLERQVDRWQRQLESYRAFKGWPGAGALPGVARIARWLQDHLPARFEPGILHGDYHFSNVLYRPRSAELAAIVDWELTTVGDPLLDLGWLLATWPEHGEAVVEGLTVSPWDGFPDAGELVSHYQAHSHRDVSSIHWYAVLACYKLALILEGTYARACAGQAPREVGERLHRSTVRLLERALSWID
ncbi:phosphotransferase family protein [Alloalcanivorax mobilis]|uniref:phosphotransferase family protein n=1 Tax=Alloalcanivorax mobilis TaxID=2019569 RepID=UPI000C75DB3A|nr:phosphotransferase family protein [Alloalcanivorax mobilis]